MNKMFPKEKQSGFSLIEIVLVVIIIATLSAMVVPRLTGRSEQARQAATKADIEVNIPTALKLYELDNGFLPTTAQGLQALFQKPTSAPIPENWNGPYLEKPPLDPWGHPYQYQSPGVHRPHDYDLYSMGKDPKPDATKDDVINWITVEADAKK
ncbi:MAG TPA: type II secretion system major pseudopilin GspG [Candidatus Omnitrophota bacterium]|nr:type II secretion system major pseudopilin GspG [Candidatus Omnitrophota bacterium]HPS37294.1 type II secretion system major pseudopilin GspG [Candidatus Omnitrophota bacterium]